LRVLEVFHRKPPEQILPGRHSAVDLEGNIRGRWMLVALAKRLLLMGEVGSDDT
jgi:hypothetical protein